MMGRIEEIGTYAGTRDTWGLKFASLEKQLSDQAAAFNAKSVLLQQ